MNDLVQRLSQGKHPVEVSLRPERTLQALQQAVSRGYVHVKFTGTRGGTELGIPIDHQRSDLRALDDPAAAGGITLVGALTLDYEPVRCIAQIDLATLRGHGRLEPNPAEDADATRKDT